MRLRLGFLALFWLAAAIISPRAQAADAPAPADGVAIDTAAGYARILFTFKEPTPVSASVADGILTIKLGRAIADSTDILTSQLPAYVTSARRDADGMTYRLALANPVALHSSHEGNHVAVDLVPDSFKGVPPELPAPPPPPKKEAPDPATLPVIKVRVGEFANFTRLVFDWPAQVEYAAYPGQGRIELKFETPVRPDFSALQTQTPPWVKNAGWHLEGTTTVVDVETDAESAFHDFRDGNKVVLDVLAPKTDASAYAPPGTSNAPLQITSLLTDAALKGTDAAKAAAPPPKAAAKPDAPPATQASDTLAPSAEQTRDGGVLHFPAARGRPVAVFLRGDTLWIVLDGHPPLETASLLAPVTALIDHADAEEDSGAAVLKLTLKTPLLAAVTETDVALDVSLSGDAATPPDSIPFTRGGADGKSTLSAALPGATHVIELADPDAGDRVLVIPAKVGKGVLAPKRFVEFEALTSAAGLAVIPYTDDMDVAVNNETAVFSRPIGLALSSASGSEGVPLVQNLAAKEGPAFVDFDHWGLTGNATVYATEHALAAAVARVPESQANKARLTLARFLLAHELAPETLGEIQLIQAADATLANDPSLSAMKGAAQYMMGRYSDARLSLSTAALGTDPHAALWRGLAEAGMADWTNARHDLLISQSVLRHYPEEWQTRARLARAETGLAQGDLAGANDALDQLSSNLNPRESVEAKLYTAELLGAQGHVNEAMTRLRVLEQTDYPPVAAKATYALVDTGLKAKKIKPDDAIETLEQLRYRWRGDSLELDTLRKLGSLYFAAARWRDGLGILRVASVNFAGQDLARDAQDDMRQAFVDLFLNGKADSMPPIEALALYYDFIELTPVGRDGDEMIRRLSDRLVAVDLLGPAEQLLDHQVTQRLDGVARAVVATKLATIYLLDHKPKEALATINDTRESRLPDEINEQRRLLEARALDGLKQYDMAAELIADDDSDAAQHLRADIYWDSSNWAVAGAKTEDLLKDRWSAPGPLSDAERAELMRAAVAYSLAGDEASLQRLAEHFKAKMDVSPDARAFAVVTEKIDHQGVAFQDLAKQIATVDSLQAFMADFKKQETAARTASN